MYVGCVMRPSWIRAYRPARTHGIGGSTLAEDPEQLQVRLERARQRLDDATPFSPDWDAATEAVDDLTWRLERARIEQFAPV